MREDIAVRPAVPAEFDEIDKLVRRSFSETSDGDGTIEARLVREIRGSVYHLPALSFVAESGGQIIGMVMFSRFPLSAQFERGHVPNSIGDELVMMSPVAVHPERLREGIGTAMLTQAIERVRAAKLARGILVEGSPAYYNRFGFVTSTPMGIFPGETCGYPQQHPECLMVQEMSTGSLAGVTGFVDYSMYPSIVEHVMNDSPRERTE